MVKHGQTCAGQMFDVNQSLPEVVEPALPALLPVAPAWINSTGEDKKDRLRHVGCWCGTDVAREMTDEMAGFTHTAVAEAKRGPKQAR